MPGARQSAHIIDVDEDGIPFGWDHVRLTESEWDALAEAADAGDQEAAEAIVAGAYARLFPFQGVV